MYAKSACMILQTRYLLVHKKKHELYQQVPHQDFAPVDHPWLY